MKKIKMLSLPLCAMSARAMFTQQTSARALLSKRAKIPLRIKGDEKKIRLSVWFVPHTFVLSSHLRVVKNHWLSTTHPVIKPYIIISFNFLNGNVAISQKKYTFNEWIVQFLQLLLLLFEEMSCFLQENPHTDWKLGINHHYFEGKSNRSTGVVASSLIGENVIHKMNVFWYQKMCKLK